MFAKCSNPDCEVSFDYREGRLIRFCKPLLDSEPPIGHSFIEHFWLCGKCSELYIFAFDCGVGIKIKRVSDKATPQDVGASRESMAAEPGRANGTAIW